MSDSRCKDALAKKYVIKLVHQDGVDLPCPPQAVTQVAAGSSKVLVVYDRESCQKVAVVKQRRAQAGKVRCSCLLCTVWAAV